MCAPFVAEQYSVHSKEEDTRVSCQLYNYFPYFDYYSTFMKILLAAPNLQNTSYVSRGVD